MKKLRKIEDLLRKTDNGFTVTGRGYKCKCHGLAFCPSPMTAEEIAKVPPKNTY